MRSSEAIPGRPETIDLANRVASRLSGSQLVHERIQALDRHHTSARTRVIAGGLSRSAPRDFSGGEAAALHQPNPNGANHFGALLLQIQHLRASWVRAGRVPGRRKICLSAINATVNDGPSLGHDLRVLIRG